MDPPLVDSTQHNYPDSTDSNSSLRRPTETWDEPLPAVSGAKLRVMCSYGGHIIPRPHDKSLCYVGGDTRMVVVDRHSSLSDLSSRLSRTLLNGHQFTLKYQLPNEDLDSLISVTTDEDLKNMIEEHDRTTSASPLKSRLRLFLFLPKPESSTSMGSLLDDAKSETWFVDALNGSGLLPRRLSDSAAIDRLFGLDGVIGNINNGSSNDLEAQATETDHGNQVKDVHSMPESPSPSPMVENTSSFGSTSSSHSMSNLPPIRIRVEEQLAQMTVAPLASGVMANYNNGISSENPTRVFSDDERSEHGRPVRLRKPPLPLQPVQHKTGGYNLTSPDSVASDSSIASANSLSRHVFHQEQAPPTARDNRAPASPNNSMPDISDPNSQIHTQQVQESEYPLHPQLDQNQQQQQQFLHIHHPGTTPVPISGYYSMYPQPHQMDQQQYPMYYFPMTQNQPFMQSNSGQPLTTPNPTLPPIYPTTQAKMETQRLVQIPNNQFQQQYMGFPQLHHPSTFAYPANDQVYYTQQPAATLSSQYQTMTASAALVVSDDSVQLSTDNNQQTRTSQPV